MELCPAPAQGKCAMRKISVKPEPANRSNLPEALPSLILRKARNLFNLMAGGKCIIHGARAGGIVLHEALRVLGHPSSYFFDAKGEKEGTSSFCGLAVYEPMKIMYENLDKIFVAIAVFHNKAESRTEIKNEIPAFIYSFKLSLREEYLYAYHQ